MLVAFYLSVSQLKRYTQSCILSYTKYLAFIANFSKQMLNLNNTMVTVTGDEVKDLIGLDSKAAMEAVRGLSEETALNYLCELFRGNGWVVSFTDTTGRSALLLSEPKNPHSVLLIVKFLIREQELIYEEARDELIDFENNLSARYGCSQFAIIALNGISAKAEKLEKFNLLLQDWDYVDDLIKNYSTTKIQEPRIQLFAHNKQTYKKACKMMKSFKSIAVIQATGTGKSFLIAKLLQDFTGDKRLVMAPSLYVIGQVREHIRWDTGNIEYMTYARSMNLSQSEIASLNPKMIVLDEFHRCGAEEWGRGVENILNAYPDAFKFGTSATPIRYMDNARDMSVELFNSNVAENLSLAQAIVRNILPMPKYVCALYTVTEEMDKLKTKIFNSRSKADTKKRMLLELETKTIDWERSHGIPSILKKYLKKNMKKFIVFCKDEDHLLEMEPAVSEWFVEATGGLEVKTYRIFDGEPKNDETLKNFKEADAKTAIHLLLSINMLNEGLHVDEVSGVVLLRPTESPNIFYQQIGRCLKVGLNYSPVIFDFVNNFKSIRTNDFLWDLEFAHSQYKAERINENLEDRCPVFTVMDEVREITEVFGELKFRLDDWEAMFERLAAYKEQFGHCNVTAPREDKEYRHLWHWLNKERNKFKKGLLEPERRDKLVELGMEWRLDQLTGGREEGWKINFDKLCAFREKYGHCNVSETNKEFGNLGGFVKDQRYRRYIGTLEQYRIDKLHSIGFEFKRNYTEGRWQFRFDELVAYKNEHGHLKVHDATNRALGQWMSKQRREFKENILDAVRLKKLNSIGFTWGEDKDAIFEENFSAMVEFYKENGHLRFPQKNTLHRVASNLRAQFRNKTLSAEKIQRLQNIGFSLEFKESNNIVRERRLKQLEQFYKENGHGNVTAQHKNYEQLREWLGSQRKQYVKGLLPAGTIKKIEALGFDWYSKKNALNRWWNNKYAELEMLYKKTGTVIFSRNQSNVPLHNWCGNQRGKYKKGKLTEEQIERLNRLDFKWEVLEAAWEEKFIELIEYKKKHGHCRVPQKKEATRLLGIWCSNMRRARKTGTLPAEKIKRLEALGYIWDVPDIAWHTKYERLKKYLQYNTWEQLRDKDYPLYDWTIKQKGGYRKGLLPEEKAMLLNMLGIQWNAIEESWNTIYVELTKYKETYGTARISFADKSFKALYSWCSTQRQNYNDNKILAERAELLNNIGFEWRLMGKDKKIKPTY
jgi:superfamily II DNA or RNA helicase